MEIEAGALRQIAETTSSWGDEVQITASAGTGIQAQRFYKGMLRDATAMAMAQALALPIRSVAWGVKGGESEADQLAIKLFEAALTDMEIGFADFIAEACTMFPQGFAPFEIVMKINAQGLPGFENLVLIPQTSISEFVTDERGRVTALRQLMSPRLIPMRKCLNFRTSKMAPEGQSIFHAAVRPFTQRMKLEQVEGVGLSRRWSGFPQMKLPQGATWETTVAAGQTSDETRALRIIKATYQDRLMGAVIPHDWEFALGGPEGNIDATMSDTIMRKDLEMVRAILGQFLLQGLRKVGTQALAGTLMDVFMYSIEAYLTTIADEINRRLIPYFFEFNIVPGMTVRPYMAYTAPRALQLGAIGQYLDALTRAGVGLTDLPTMNFLRSLVPGMPLGTAAGKPVETGEGQDEEEVDRQATEKKPAEKKPAADTEQAARRGVAFFAIAPEDRARAYTEVTDAHARAQRAYIEQWTAETATSVSATATEEREGLLRLLDDLVLVALLAFRERSVLDIAAAFWLGFGKPSGPPEALQKLQGEIRLADEWIGYGDGGRLVRVNPLGRGTLFGDIAGELEGQIAALLLLLKQRKTEEVFLTVEGAVKAATRGYSRVEQYSGHVWRAVWSGALAAEMLLDEHARVRWVLDPEAAHCRECPQYAREYPNIGELLATTGGTLPGHGTECDGRCRCHIEIARGGQWQWM